MTNNSEDIDLSIFRIYIDEPDRGENETPEVNANGTSEQDEHDEDSCDNAKRDLYKSGKKGTASLHTTDEAKSLLGRSAASERIELRPSTSNGPSEQVERENLLTAETNLNEIAEETDSNVNVVVAATSNAPQQKSTNANKLRRIEEYLFESTFLAEYGKLKVLLFIAGFLATVALFLAIPFSLFTLEFEEVNK